MNGARPGFRILALVVTVLSAGWGAWLWSDARTVGAKPGDPGNGAAAARKDRPLGPQLDALARSLDGLEGRGVEAGLSIGPQAGGAAAGAPGADPGASPDGTDPTANMTPEERAQWRLRALAHALLEEDQAKSSYAWASRSKSPELAAAQEETESKELEEKIEQTLTDIRNWTEGLAENREEIRQGVLTSLKVGESAAPAVGRVVEEYITEMVGFPRALEQSLKATPPKSRDELNRLVEESILARYVGVRVKLNADAKAALPDQDMTRFWQVLDKEVQRGFERGTKKPK